MNIKNRSLTSAFFSIFTASIIGLVISVIFTPVIVRLLGVDEYGNFAFVLSVLGLLMIVANSGVTRGVKKYIPEEDRPPMWQSAVFGFYTRLSVVLIVLVAMPILLLSSVDFFGFLDPPLVFYFQLMAIVLCCKQLYWLTKNALQALGYERYSEPIKIFHRASYAVGAIGLAYLGFGVAGVLVAYAVSLGVATAIALRFLHQSIDLRLILRRHLSLPRRQLLTFNLLSVLLMFLMVSLYHFDVIILRLVTGTTQTGYYKAALVVAQLMWLLPKALQSLLLHSASNYWSAEQYDRIDTVGSLATRSTLVMTVLMAAGLIVLADDFMPLYFGSGFSAAVIPMILLLPGVIGFAVARPMYAIGQGSGKLRILIAASGTAATINVVLNLLLIPLFGMQGAAVATSIGYGSMAILYTIASKKIGFNPVNDLRLGRIGFAGLIALIAMLTADQIITNEYLSLGIIPGIGGIVYLFVIFRTGTITEHEAKRFTDYLPDLVATRTNRLVSIISPS